MSIFAASLLFQAVYVGVKPAPIEKLPLGFGFRTHDEALARADFDIAEARERLKIAPEEWIRLEGLARAMLSRARLTGDFRDFAATGAVLDRALAVSEPNGGPLLTDAAWAMLVHKLPRVERDVAMIRSWKIPEVAEQVDADVQDGDVRFHRGDYAGALRLYRAANARAADTGAQMRIAQWHAKMGQPAAAIAMLEATARSLDRPSRPVLAAILLQLGTIALQSGDWNAAEARFIQADELFPGYWLYQAHRSQMLAVRGDIPAAIRSYQAIVRRQRAPGPLARGRSGLKG